jgi:FixJ family two-component response regulator
MEELAMRQGAAAYLRKPFDEEAPFGAIALAMKSLYNNKMDDKEGDRTG